MEKSATRVESPLPTPRATRIEDLSPVGDELSEEQLRLVTGARLPDKTRAMVNCVTNGQNDDTIIVPD